MEFGSLKTKIETKAIEGFRKLDAYDVELDEKAAAKIQETHLVAQSYLRESPDGNFDGFVKLFLAGEEKTLRSSDATLVQAEGGSDNSTYS